MHVPPSTMQVFLNRRIIHAADAYVAACHWDSLSGMYAAGDDASVSEWVRAALNPA